MRKLFAVLLACMTFMFTLTACAESDDNEKDSTVKTTEEKSDTKIGTDDDKNASDEKNETVVYGSVEEECAAVVEKLIAASEAMDGDFDDDEFEESMLAQGITKEQISRFVNLFIDPETNVIKYFVFADSEVMHFNPSEDDKYYVPGVAAESASDLSKIMKLDEYLADFSAKYCVYVGSTDSYAAYSLTENMSQHEVINNIYENLELVESMGTLLGNIEDLYIYELNMYDEFLYIPTVLGAAKTGKTSIPSLVME